MPGQLTDLPTHVPCTLNSAYSPVPCSLDVRLHQLPLNDRDSARGEGRTSI